MNNNNNQEQNPNFLQPIEHQNLHQRLVGRNHIGRLQDLTGSPSVIKRIMGGSKRSQ